MDSSTIRSITTKALDMVATVGITTAEARQLVLHLNNIVDLLLEGMSINLALKATVMGVEQA